MVRLSQLRGVELSFLTLILLLSTGGFIHFLQGTVDFNAARTGNWLTNGIWVISYLLATVALYTRAKLRRAALRRCWPLFLLVSFALLSIIWSEDRYLTFLRTGALAGTIVGGLYLGERLTLGARGPPADTHSGSSRWSESSLCTVSAPVGDRNRRLSG